MTDTVRNPIGPMGEEPCMSPQSDPLRTQNIDPPREPRSFSDRVRPKLVPSDTEGEIEGLRGEPGGPSHPSTLRVSRCLQTPFIVRGFVSEETPETFLESPSSFVCFRLTPVIRGVTSHGPAPTTQTWCPIGRFNVSPAVSALRRPSDGAEPGRFPGLRSVERSRGG